MKSLRTAFCLVMLVSPFFTRAQQDAPATATIVFYRPHRFEGFGLKPSVYVDEVSVGRMGNGEGIRISVPEGHRLVYSNDKATGIDLDARAGETYYARIDIKTGALKGHGAILLVDPQQGKYEVTQVKIKGASAE